MNSFVFVFSKMFAFSIYASFSMLCCFMQRMQFCLLSGPGRWTMHVPHARTHSFIRHNMFRLFDWVGTTAHSSSCSPSQFIFPENIIFESWCFGVVVAVVTGFQHTNTIFSDYCRRIYFHRWFTVWSKSINLSEFSQLITNVEWNVRPSQNVDGDDHIGHSYSHDLLCDLLITQTRPTEYVG